MNKYYIGIDIGGTTIKGGIVDSAGTIIAKEKIVTNVKSGGDAIVLDIQALIIRLSAQLSDMLFGCNEKWETIKEYIGGVGLGSPGVVDSAAGIVRYANNLHWQNQAVCRPLEEKIGLACAITNDANCAALGESERGAARFFNSSVTFTLGTGVGSGIILNKQLFEGFNSAGAEFGHMVVKANGEPCTCGRNGCMEAYSSATALIRDTRLAMEQNRNSLMWEYANDKIENVGGKTAFTCAYDYGDETAKRVVAEYINYLGEGVANAVNILRPEAVIIGGGVSGEGSRLIDPLTEAVSKKVYGGFEHAPLRILQAKLGNDAGIIGAASLVKQKAEL